MARIRQYTHRFNSWDQTTSAVTTNISAFQHLEAPNTKLLNVAVTCRGLVLEQAALDARKQELAKTLKQLIQEGDTLTDLLRTGVRQHYGYRSEKLVEFGIDPIRPENRKRKARKAAKEAQAAAEAPETAAPDPAQ